MKRQLKTTMTQETNALILWTCLVGLTIEKSPHRAWGFILYPAIMRSL
ncbi:hypothetical protein [Legionella erythra]|nr:hypothetical protein [Legionella erythra]